MAEGRKRITIAVLGAGYGGLTAFLELQDRLDRRAHDLVLVNASPYHYYVTELHTLATGVEEEEVLRIPLRRVVRPPGRLQVARVERLVPQEKAVLFDAGALLQYDYCIVGLGSDPEYFGLPGVREHALVVGNPEGARLLRTRIAELVTCGHDRPHRVAVAGGGLTGVEVAGELADAYPDCMEVTLIEAGPEIMGGFDPYLVREARRVLEEKGIAIRTGNPIAQAEDGHLTFKDGAMLPFDLLVWAGGVRGSGILADSGFVTTPKGRVRTDAYLRAEGFPDVYLVGDAAAFTDPATGREVPPTAQAAVQMGRAAARSLLAELQGRPLAAFTPRVKGAFASLGKGAGVGYIGEDKYTGLPATVMKRLIEAHHAYEAGGLLPIISRALRPLAGWLGLRVRPRRRLPAQPAQRPGGPELSTR